MKATVSTAAPASETRTRLIRAEAYGALVLLFSVALFLALVTFRAEDASVRVGSGIETKNLLGPVGAQMAQFFLWLFGLGAFPMDFALGYVGIRGLFRRPLRLDLVMTLWAACALLMLVSLLHIALPRDFRPFGAYPGGIVGVYSGEVLIALFSVTGASVLSASLFAISSAALCGLSLGKGLAGLLRLLWRAILRFFALAGALFRRSLRPLARVFKRVKEEKAVATEVSSSEPPDLGATKVGVRRGERPLWGQSTLASTKEPRDIEPYWVEEIRTAVDEAPVPKDEAELSTGASAEKESRSLTEVTKPRSGPTIVPPPKQRYGVQEVLPLETEPPSEGKCFVRPSLALLDSVPPRTSSVDADLLRRNAETLERKLLDYKVEGRVVQIHPGPVVTMYEFLPAPGVKISQIANLEDDLTMALEAMSIRIVAPIPGKGVVGIEVPNAVRETVYLREILASEAFARSKSKLTLALGKDIFGNPVVADLAKMPHLLIAGATGSGKSVAINAFLMSLLYNATPDEVRIILVDPKVVELQVYEGVPHLLLPVVYDPKHAAAALRWAVEEMERRYEVLARFGTRNIQSFNQKVEKALAEGGPSDSDGTEEALETDDPDFKKMPYIVIVLDEFADLMMVAAKEVETAVARLAQKARAAGIHLIMATQRPSKEVITGLIKANFTCRISFRVSSKVDSRIILDQNGAESLLGYGDMLFLRPGTSVLTRVHGPFVSEEEVERVVTFLKAQGAPEYKLEILQSAKDVQEEDEGELDPLYDEAVGIVLEERRASISYLQRRLKVGYNRAARIMEQMERRGIVGPPDSRGERQVLT